MVDLIVDLVVESVVIGLASRWIARSFDELFDDQDRRRATRLAERSERGTMSTIT